MASFLGLGVLEADVVANVFVHPWQPTIAVDGLIVTREHPLLLPDGGWRMAGDFRVGDEWVRADGSTAVVGVIGEGPTTTVYNIEVSRNHTYIAGGIRVHNKAVSGGGAGGGGA